MFYRTPDGELMSARVRTEPEFSHETPELVLRYPYASDYDISADGKRFLMIKGGDDDGWNELVLVQNWVEEPKRLVPPR